MPVQVLAVLPGNTAVVSTERLFRVVFGAKRETVEEFLDVHQAAQAVATLRRAGQLAEAVPYSALAVEERDDYWKAQYATDYPQVLAIHPRCLVISSVDWYRVAWPDGTPQHEFCDLDQADSLAGKSPHYENDDGTPVEFIVQSYDSLVSPAAKPLASEGSGVATEAVTLPA